MIHNGSVMGAPLINYIGTQAEIEAAHSTEGMSAYATDLKRVGYCDGVWVWTSSGGTSVRATTEVAGIVELATEAEAEAGTDVERVITPASLRAALHVLAWIGLADTPASYSGHGVNYGAIVNAAETGLEFIKLFITDGLSGGQTLIGGVDALDSLMLRSTAHATRGRVQILDDVTIQPATDTEGTLQVNNAAGLNIVSVDAVRNAFVVKQEFLNTNPDLADMGSETESDLRGYGADYIADKRLSNVLLGGSARTENGGIRMDVAQDPDTFEIFLRGAWQTIIYDLTTEDGDFKHIPLTLPVYVWRGDSVMVGLNLQPVVQEYKTSMGACPTYRVIDGGAF